MSLADDPDTNAFAESFWIEPPKQPFESGSIGRRPFLSVDDARTEIFRNIEMYYNLMRKHSSPGYKSPEQLEDK